ncbi:MAG: PAS domain-containing protein [Parvibaculum sp.]|nr:PAS domain-containing protein [Parvibaculum sp.]
MSSEGTDFRDARLARLYAWWCKKKGDRIAPLRAELDPTELLKVLSIMHLIDVSWEPFGFRHRLIGTELVERMGRDVTGQWVDEKIYGTATKDIFDGLAAVATEMRPYRRLSRLDWHARSWLGIEALEMPLLDEEGKVNMILRGASYFAAGADWGDERRMSWPVGVCSAV